MTETSVDASSVDSASSRRVELLLLAAGWGANHFSTLLVVYRKELALSPAELGILFGAYALGLVPGLLLAGRASDRRGRRALVLPASLMAIGASAVLSFGGNGFAVLLAGRLLYGLAMGSVMSPGSVWVQELSPPAVGARRATLALSAGFGFGPMVSGLIAELSPSPMVLPYVVHGLVMALALRWARVVPETVSMPRTLSDASPFPLPLPRAHPVPTPRDTRRRTMAALVALLPLGPWAFGFAAVTLAILPGLMRPHVSRPVLYSAFVILTTLLSGVAVQQPTRRLGERADRLGLGLGVLGILLAAHAVAVGSPRLVFGVAVLVGSGYGMVMTTGLLEIAGRVEKEVKGTAVGIYYVLTYVGFALPFVHATAARHCGDAATLRITALVAFACLVIRIAIASRRRRSN